MKSRVHYEARYECDYGNTKGEIGYHPFFSGNDKEARKDAKNYIPKLLEHLIELWEEDKTIRRDPKLKYKVGPKLSDIKLGKLTKVIERDIFII